MMITCTLEPPTLSHGTYAADRRRFSAETSTNASYHGSTTCESFDGLHTRLEFYLGYCSPNELPYN